MTQQRATIIINRTPEESRQQHDDFMRLHGGKSAVDLMMDNILRRERFIHRHRMNFGFHDNFFTNATPRQQFYYLPDSLVPKSAFKLAKRLKQSAESLVQLVSSRTALYELARLFAPLSTQTANYQRGISERVVESMTFYKLTSKNLNILLFKFGVNHHEQKRLFTTP